MRRIIVHVGPALLLFLLFLTPAEAVAQTRELTGTVTNAMTRAPIAGVVVSAAAASLTARTNERGEFRLSVPAGEITLVARAIGYVRRQLSIRSDQQAVYFDLENDVLQLEGVIVTGQATTVERRNAAVSVVVVSANELNRVPSASLENALQGKVVGASINMNSGAPGGGGQVQIRGVTSIRGQGDPLYVVDGAIISNIAIPNGAESVTQAQGGIGSIEDNPVNRLADISPNQIETIEVLKGAAASAMYGSKATNGVVIITTKRGNTGSPVFDLTQRVGYYEPVRLLGSRRFRSKQDLLNAIDPSNPGHMAIVSSMTDSVPYYNHQGDLYGERTLSYETAGSMSGGTDNTRYFVAASQKRDGGTMLNTESRLQSLRINFDQVLGSRWTMGLGSNASHTFDRRGLSNNDNSFTSPIYTFAYTPAVMDLQARDPNTGLFVRNPFPGGGGPAASNPFETMTHLDLYGDVMRFMGSGHVIYRALKGQRHNLSVGVRAGADFFTQNDRLYSPNFLQYEGNDGLFGTAEQSLSNSRMTNASLNGVWVFAPSRRGFHATTSGGVQVEKANLTIARIQGSGLLPTVRHVASPPPTQTRTEETLQSTLDQAFYAQEEILALDERLLLTAAVRAERSSLNGNSRRFFAFPRFSGSYRLKVREGPDELKLRASFGTSGNRPPYGSKYETLASGGVINGGNSIVRNFRLGNSNIQPETMHETEVGLDARVLDDRIGMELTHFRRRVTNLILFAPLAPSSGVFQEVINGGTLANTGWEIAATLIPIRRRDLTWKSRMTYYHFRNVVQELPVPAFVAPSVGFGATYGYTRIAVGASTSSIWGNTHRYCAIDPAAAMKTWRRCTPDEFRNNLGTLKDTIIGDANPKFQMQFAHDLAWRAVGLSALFDWKNGGQMSNMTKKLFDEGLNSWDYDHPSPAQCPVPNGACGKTLGEYRYNARRGGSEATMYLENASYLKLREIAIWWSAPARVTNRLGLSAKNLRVAVSARNVYTWTRYWGVDPEVSSLGNNSVARIVDLAPYPPSRSFFVTIGMGF